MSDILFKEMELCCFGLVSVFPKNQLANVHATCQKYDATRNRPTFVCPVESLEHES
jgi:hypothetical protein